MLAIGIAGCGGGGGAAQTSPRQTTTAPGVSLTRPHSRRPPSALDRLRAVLARTLHHAGPGTGAEILDLTSGKVLFAVRPAVKRPPASVEKLYTTVAVLGKLGAAVRLQTRVLGVGHLGPGGTWLGDLYLVGGGDPTFGDGAFNRNWEEGYGPTAAELVTQLAGRGIRRVTGAVIGDESLFDSRRGGPATGYAPDVPDFGGQLSALTYDHGSSTASLSPAAFAARQLARTMRARHIRAKAIPATRRAPADAVPLASVSSPPMAVLLKLMDVPSDDLFAELLAKQLGARFAGQGTISAGAGVISEVALIWGVHPVIVDGSGLSRADRSSPAEVVALLKGAWGSQTGDQLEAALPVVGVSGTVAHIATGTPAQGNCVAKTGTLNDVSNLAGFCRDREHHVLAFAFFLDGPENSVGLALIGRLVADLARY